MSPPERLPNDWPSLSIVIQGPLKASSDEQGYSTISVLLSARHHYPQAEIIYSGWNGTQIPKEVRDIADKIVLSEDPGPTLLFTTPQGAVCENINRQIVSTIAGLKAARYPYAMKTRSDTLFVANCLPGWLHRQGSASLRSTLFKSPLIASSQYTRLYFFEYGGFRPCLAHLSDLFFFGLKDDLLRYWDGPLVGPNPHPVRDIQSTATVEQILSVRCLSNRGILPSDTQITTKFDKLIGSVDFRHWKLLLASNFIVLNERDLGILHPRRFIRWGLSRLLFESDASIAKLANRRGLISFLAAWLIKVVVFLEYQIKFAVRWLVGAAVYRMLARNIISCTKRWER